MCHCFAYSLWLTHRRPRHLCCRRPPLRHLRHPGELPPLKVSTHTHAHTPLARDIDRKELDIGFKAVTFVTYGAFGKATHGLITATTANTPRPVFNPWVRPSPEQHAYLLFGFTLARANARMLINAASKRSNAKNAVRTSRSRSH